MKQSLLRPLALALVSLSASLLLVGCGYKGPLTMPQLTQHSANSSTS